jgi:hypothetical protein
MPIRSVAAVDGWMLWSTTDPAFDSRGAWAFVALQCQKVAVVQVVHYIRWRPPWNVYGRLACSPDASVCHGNGVDALSWSGTQR